MEEEKMEKLEFYHELLLQMVDTKKYPFYHLIISKGMSKKEMEDVFRLCEELSEKYEKQREEGFVHFTPLLIEFVGMLPYSLDPKETILALKQQKLYEELMDVLLDVMIEIDR